MGILKKGIFAAFLFLLTMAFLAESAYSLPNPVRRVRRYRARQAIKRHKKAAKVYRYKRTHDINNDGVVNARDRLLWLKRKGGNYAKVLVSADNDDIVEVMDIDGDGNVEEWEMQAFYDNYDLNNDGVIDDYEMNQATD